MSTSEKTRLNKYIAHTGFCTRREAGEMIKKGKVSVDGELVDNPGLQVDDSNEILIEGVPLQNYEDPEYYLINKPKDFVCSPDEEGKYLLGLVKETKSKRLAIAHPLSAKGTGLQVVSNDEKLMARLLKNSATIKSVYHAKLGQEINRATADIWEEKLGDNIRYISIINDEFYDIAIEAGAEIESMLTTFIAENGNEIIRLDRNYYAGLTKKDMPRGRCRKLTDKEVIMLKHFS